LTKKEVRKMSVQISMRVSKEQKEKLVELAKKQNKSLTQYVLDRCIVEDVNTNIYDATHSSSRVEKMLQDQIDQLREDFERERTQLVDQIDQKDKQIADMIETSNSQLQLIGALTMKNETLLLETKKSWWQRLFSKKDSR
jgi:predicted DNA-binding protein